MSIDQTVAIAGIGELAQPQLNVAAPQPSAAANETRRAAVQGILSGRRCAMVVYSEFPFDPRPRRAIEALVAAGMHIDLICTGAKRTEHFDGLTVTRIPLEHKRSGVLAYAYEYLSFLFLSGFIQGWRTLRRRYDLVYVHNMPDFLVFSAAIPKLLGAKVILDQHDPMPELMETIFELEPTSMPVKALRLAERWSLAFADRVITVNHAFKRLFSRRSCREDKVTIVMNSPDTTIFRSIDEQAPAVKREGEPAAILYHGSLVERNGLELAIDALALLKPTHPSLELWICGRSTPFLERLLVKAVDLGVDKQISYRGSRTLEQIAQDIRECTIGVVPNLRNVFTDINTPTRIFEYLALGKPVIAPRTEGILDYFGANDLFYFESGDARDLARQLALALANPDLQQETLLRGQRVYRQHLWDVERSTLVRTVARTLAIQ